MKVVLFIVLGLVCLTASAEAKIRGNYRTSVTALPGFQTDSGGFRVSPSSPRDTMEGTAHAAFLASLYGVRQTIDADGAIKFMNSLQNADYGYGRHAGLASDLESVAHAVAAHNHLGASLPSPSSTVSYIVSLLDSSSGMYAPRTGERADLRSTFLALSTLETLKGLDASGVQDSWPKLKSKLASSVKDSTHFSFDGLDAADLVANYYGITIARIIKFDLPGSLPKWASWITDYQILSPDAQRGQYGGLASDESKSSATIASTSAGLRSLASLNDKYPNLLDGPGLEAYVSAMPLDLEVAALAHGAIALTSIWDDQWTTSIEWISQDGTPIGDNVVAGSAVKPVVRLSAFDGLYHGGLSLSGLMTTPASSSKSSVSLALVNPSDASQGYAPQEYTSTSSSSLGRLSYSLVAKASVLGLPSRSWTVDADTPVGHGLSVEAMGSYAGRPVSPGDALGLGAKLTLTPSGSSGSGSPLPVDGSGDWTPTWTVTDSSGSVVHTKSGSKGSLPPLEWTYESDGLPPGPVTFGLSLESSGFSHSRASVVFASNSPLVGRSLSWSKSDKSFGLKDADTASVSWSPAVIPSSGGSPTPLATSDSRVYYMDVSSASGSRLESVVGLTASNGVVSFSIPLPKSLDVLGSHVCSFRYVDDSGRSFSVEILDSDDQVLDDPAASLTYTPTVSPAARGLSGTPSSGAKLSYGAAIKMGLSLYDSVSGLALGPGSSSSLSLALAPADGGSPIHAPATPSSASDGTWNIDWTVTANAPSGSASLSLVTLDASGGSSTVKTDGSAWSVSVSVGGDISARDVRVFSNSAYNQPESVFNVLFSLYSGSTELSNAGLSASVYAVAPSLDRTLIRTGVPVGTGPDGSYALSWFGRTTDFPSGEYALDFHRSSSSSGEPMFSLTLSHTGAPSWIQTLPVYWGVVAGLVFVFYKAQTFGSSLQA